MYVCMYVLGRNPSSGLKSSFHALKSVFLDQIGGSHPMKFQPFCVFDPFSPTYDANTVGARLGPGWAQAGPHICGFEANPTPTKI